MNSNINTWAYYSEINWYIHKILVLFCNKVAKIELILIIICITHCVPDVVWGHWKYMGSDKCHLIGLDTHKPKCYVENSEKILFWRKLSLKFKTAVTPIIFYLLWILKEFFFNELRDTAHPKSSKAKHLTIFNFLYLQEY